MLYQTFTSPVCKCCYCQ